MSLQPMPIADQLLAGAPIRKGDGSPSEIKRDGLNAGIRSAFRVNAQVASELYWRGTQNYYNLKTHFGPLRLPYPQMWFEWQLPATAIIEGTEAPVPLQYQCAAFAQEKEHEDGYDISVTLLMSAPGNGFVTTFGASDMLELDHRGHYRERIIAIHERATHGPSDEMIAEAIGAELNVAYLAISLMHCKNVNTKRHERPVVRTKKMRRERPAKVDYHTIVLPSSSGSDSGDGVHQDVMPMHRVRGHFKTFTDAAPLLGKHVGTYWWGWQVRGNKANGITVTDYKVGVA